MECFASHAAVDHTQIRVQDPGFGSPGEFDPLVKLRGLLCAEEAEHRLGELFSRFTEQLHAEHARGELEGAHHWALRATTQLHSDLALSVRIFRELLPQAFLMTLFGPNVSGVRPRYVFTGLDELRGMNGHLVFTGTAKVCEPDTVTL